MSKTLNFYMKTMQERFPPPHLVTLKISSEKAREWTGKWSDERSELPPTFFFLYVNIIEVLLISAVTTEDFLLALFFFLPGVKRVCWPKLEGISGKSPKGILDNNEI